MTQTDTTAAIAEARRRLAEMPCPEQPPHGSGPEGYLKFRHWSKCFCQGTGRAFPWASVVCGFVSYTTDGAQHTVACICNGSGRVPKALTTDDLWEHGIYSITKYAPDRYGAVHDSDIHILAAEGETPLLAALRAVEQAG